MFLTLNQHFLEAFYFGNVIHHCKKLDNIEPPDQTFPESLCPTQNMTNGHHHQPEDIGINLSTKLYLKPTTWSF